VLDQVANTGFFFNSNQIFNGIDSSSLYTLNSNFPKGIVTVSKSIEGSIGKDAFKILFNDDIDVKIIYLNNVAIMATKGRNKPNYIIPIQQGYPSSITSLLLLIAYSEIFQSPN
jgi:hypothetical protein